jgi:hypothetical protein
VSNQVKIQYAVDEKMPVSLAILQALQHVIALFSSVVVVPVIVANATDVPREQLEYIIFATIIVTAVSTLIQAVRIGKIGSGYILFTGTSATFLSCSLVAADIGGFALVATMSVLAAPLEFLIAYFLDNIPSAFKQWPATPQNLKKDIPFSAPNDLAIYFLQSQLIFPATISFQSPRTSCVQQSSAPAASRMVKAKI